MNACLQAEGPDGISLCTVTLDTLCATLDRPHLKLRFGDYVTTSTGLIIVAG
jgi:hypothetical protein